MILSVLLAQATAPQGDWVSTLLTATGPAGVIAMILWKVRNDAETEKAELRDTIRELTNRLFTLADRGMAVGQTASEVAANESRDPELVRLMEDVRASLRERGR